MTTANPAGHPAGTLTHAPILIWVAGRCFPNPGAGSFAWIARDPYGTEAEGSRPSLTQTTNSRTVIAAALNALQALPGPSTATVHTDSEYLQLGAERRAADWQAFGWRNKEGKPVPNSDLWERLMAAAAPHTITWVWVGKRSGDPMMARVGALANKARANRAQLTAQG